MTKNGKEMSKKIENGYGNNINGTPYQVMEEINENEKGRENGRVERNNQKWQCLDKMKKINVKMLVETVDRMKKCKNTNIVGEKEWKDKPVQSARRMNDWKWQTSEQKEWKWMQKEDKCEPVPTYGGKKWKWQKDWRMTVEKGTTENDKKYSKKEKGLQDIVGSWR